MFCIFLPAPGILTVVLAFLAALISMPTFNERMKNPWLRATAIFVFCLIAAGEIAIIQHADSVTTAERKKQNDDHLVELAAQQTRYTNEMQSLQKIQDGLQIVNSSIAREKSRPVLDSLRLKHCNWSRIFFSSRQDVKGSNLHIRYLSRLNNDRGIVRLLTAGAMRR